MFLNSHCNKSMLKFAYKKYLDCFTLQCLKLLILKEEKKSCTLFLGLLFLISSGSPFFFLPHLTPFV